MSRSVLFDIEVFTAVYVHAAEGMAASQLNQQADSFSAQCSTLVRSVAASTMQLHETAQSMASAAETTTGQARTALTAGEETAGNATAVATTTDQLTASIQEIRPSGSNQSTRIAGTAVEGGKSDRRTGARIGGRPEARIGDVVRADQRCRQSDQPAGTERNDRGGARGRGGQGLCGRRRRGEEPRQPDGKATEEIAAEDRRGAERNAGCRHGHPRHWGATIGQISEIACSHRRRRRRSSKAPPSRSAKRCKRWPATAALPTAAWPQ